MGLQGAIVGVLCLLSTFLLELAGGFLRLPPAFSFVTQYDCEPHQFNRSSLLSLSFRLIRFDPGKFFFDVFSAPG
jgi:hypothetical protein